MRILKKFLICLLIASTLANLDRVLVGTNGGEEADVRVLVDDFIKQSFKSVITQKVREFFDFAGFDCVGKVAFAFGILKGKVLVVNVLKSDDGRYFQILHDLTFFK